jgi:hypothetical protein
MDVFVEELARIIRLLLNRQRRLFCPSRLPFHIKDQGPKLSGS